MAAKVTDLVASKDKKEFSEAEFDRIFGDQGKDVIDIMAVYRANIDPLSKLDKGSAERFLIQGQKVKEAINSKVAIGGIVTMKGFVVKRGGNLGKTDMNYSRLTACIALHALENNWGIETAMYKRLDERLKVSLADIKTLIAPGLHFLYKPSLDKDIHPVLGTIACAPGKIVVAALAIDHLTFVVTTGTGINFKDFIEDKLENMRGAFTGIISNMGAEGIAGLRMDQASMQFVKDCLGQDYIPTSKGGVQSRAKKIIGEIMSRK